MTAAAASNRQLYLRLLGNVRPYCRMLALTMLTLQPQNRCSRRS